MGVIYIIIKKSILDRLLILTTIGLLLLVPCTSLFSAKMVQVQSPLLKTNYAMETEYEFTYELTGLKQKLVTADIGEFTLFTIENSGYLGELGKPQLPIWTEFYAIPDTEVTLQIIDTHIQEYRHIDTIYPAQPPETDSTFASQEFYSPDPTFQSQNTLYPGKIAEITGTGYIRDIPYAQVVFYPLQYNPSQQLVTIHDQITIKLTFNNPIKNIFVNQDFETDPFYSIYENSFTNWNTFKTNRIATQTYQQNDLTRLTGCDYLIITHPNFYSQAQDLAEWKHRKGLITKIVNVTDIGSTSTVIRNYIQNAYDTWTPQPSYLLLIGDAEYIPTNYVYSAASDLWYATVSGSDYYADLYFGRLSADTASQANILVQKILSYEQTPPTLPSYYTNFSVAAYFQDDEHNGYETRRFVRTSEEVRDYLLTQSYNGERIYVTESYINPTHYNNGYYGNGEPLPSELLRTNGFPWNGDDTDITNAIEQGIFILNHRDHGFEYGWGDPYFDTSDIASLTNGALQPVVFSINCLTGRFDNYECFSEDFVRKPNGGAVAVFGATRVSYSGYNDFLCRGFYDAIWPNFDTSVGTSSPIYELGAILNYGKYYMANTWGNPWGYERYSFELFHIFGDPNMKIWTAQPETLTVTHPNDLYLGSSTFTVHVEDSTSNDIENAYVCLYKDDEVYLVDYTDSSGNVVFNPSPSTPGMMNVTVTKHNYLPYIDEAEVIQGNLPPNQPTNPSPTNGSTTIGINNDLSWDCTDPNGDPLTYTILFEADDPTPDILVSTNQSGTTYDPGTMLTNTQYYWQIIAWDDNSAYTYGPIWTFTTENTPPYIPINPTPNNGATNVNINADISWTGGDPDPGDTVTYVIYFGTSNPPPQVINNQTTTTYDPSTLSYLTTYYWKIIAWDNHGASTQGSIWDFTTEQQPNIPPNTPNTPNPPDGAIDVDINADISWIGGDPNPGDTVTYDIYFGTTTSPPQIAANQSSTNYDPGTMNYDETYYWKIIAWDNHGATTSGPQWHFTTGTYINNAPNQPNNPSPANGSIDVTHPLISWNCTDPDGDTLVYDIYFEADDPTPDTLIADDHTETTYTLTELQPSTTYYWQIIAKDTYGASTSGPIWSFTTIDAIPDLDCAGTLSWIDVKPGATVTGTITVENIGDPYSLLDWEIDTYPDWGTWTFTPTQGQDLTPEQGSYTINITVIAPSTMNKQFSGNIKIINTNNPADYDTIYVTLATPQTHQTIIQIILQRIIQSFPNAFPILQQLLL